MRVHASCPATLVASETIKAKNGMKDEGILEAIETIGES
jgi:hypothetical protein